jgi:ABC-type maltose transport system permease subunit
MPEYKHTTFSEMLVYIVRECSDAACPIASNSFICRPVEGEAILANALLSNEKAAFAVLIAEEKSRACEWHRFSRGNILFLLPVFGISACISPHFRFDK